MLKYFDLNNRASKAWIQISQTTKEIRTEAEGEVKRVEEIRQIAPSVKLSPISQILMYLGIFIGVLFSSVVNQFAKGDNFSITVNISILLISAVIAFTLIPIVYEKLKLNPGAPFIVQFGIFIQNGVFWHVIINSIGKITSSS